MHAKETGKLGPFKYTIEHTNLRIVVELRIGKRLLRTKTLSWYLERSEVNYVLQTLAREQMSEWRRQVDDLDFQRVRTEGHVESLY